MRNEHNTDYTDLNPFEAPANLWDRVEAGLNQQKSKRRAIIWWWAAAGIAVLGMGYVGIQFLSNNSVLQENIIAKNEQPEVLPSDTVQGEKQDTINQEKAYSFGGLQPLAHGPDVVEESDILTQKEAESRRPGIPSAPAAYRVAPNPFGDGGSGGGQGGGNGSGSAVDYPNVTISAPLNRNRPDRSIDVERVSPSALVEKGVADMPTVLNTVPGATVEWTAANTTIVQSQTQNLSFSYTSPPPSVSVNANATTQPTYGAINGGPVNQPTNGVLEGVYVNEHTPTKRMIGYPPVSEANVHPDNRGRLNGYDQSSASSYESINENPFKPTSADPLSTFSIDVDGASYSDVRGMINRNTLPNPNAVRLEEFINYFPYAYEEPQGEHPFSIHTEFSPCPWNEAHQLLKVGIKGESIEKAQLPTNNLVFLLDVSGSMNQPEKLELLKKGFRLLVNELREEDRVAIAVYAGAAGLVLPPTSGANKDQILDALNKLQAGGSTAGGQGINLAYKTAEEYFDPQGNNRIILATDGDFNVGISGNDALVKLIEEKRKSGVYLTVLGFGHDNFQSDKMEKIANNGNGNFSFIDNILEAKKVLVTEMGATLKTIAKDVKIQVEFNPAHVGSYRLLGYENRMLQHQDFANDTVDAGELGAGHTVTAVYEIIPKGSAELLEQTDDTELKYTRVEKESNGYFASELATVKFRYKHPDGVKSKLIEQVIPNTPQMKPSSDFEFIQAVIEFGLMMRQSQYAGNADFDAIIERASKALGDDNFGYRKEFIMLVEKAKLLADPQVE